MADWPRELSFMELLHELVPANIRLQPHHNVTDELVEQYLRALGLPYKMVKRSDYVRVLIPTDKDLPIDREHLQIALGKTVASMGSFRINEIQIGERQNQLTFARLMAIRLRWENIPLNVVWDRWLREQREQVRQKLAARRVHGLVGERRAVELQTPNLALLERFERHDIPENGRCVRDRPGVGLPVETASLHFAAAAMDGIPEQIGLGLMGDGEPAERERLLGVVVADPGDGEIVDFDRRKFTV